MVGGILVAVGLLTHGAHRRADAGGRTAGVTRGLDDRTALQLDAAALAVGVAGIAVRRTGGRLGVLHLRAARMVGGVLVAVSLAAVVADRTAGAGGRAALMLGGQLLPRQHRQTHIAAGQPLAAAVGIPRMHTAPRDQSRQHRAVGERRGGLGRCLAHHGVVAASGLIRRGVQIIAVLKPVALRSQGVIRYHSAHDAAGAIHSSLFQGAHIVAAPEGQRSRGVLIPQTGPRRDTACIGIILCLGAFDLTGIVAVGYQSDAVDLADDAGSQRLGGHGTEIDTARDGKGVALVFFAVISHKAGRLAAGHCGGVDAVGDGDRAHAVAQKAAAIAAGCAGGDAARYGQVPENRITRASEQAEIHLGAVDIQVPDGMSAAVKGAAVRLLDAQVLPDAYGRPELALQVDVRRQHGAGSGVLRPAVLAVDDVAERLQLLRVGDAVGVLLRAAARNDLAPLGLEGHRAGDRRIKIIRRAVLKPVAEVETVQFRVGGSDRLLVLIDDLDGIGSARLPVVIGHGAAAIGDGAGVAGIEGAACKNALISGIVFCSFPVVHFPVKGAATDLAMERIGHLTVKCTIGDQSAVSAIKSQFPLARDIIVVPVCHRAIEDAAADRSIALLFAYIVRNRAVEGAAGELIFVYYCAIECAASGDGAPYISDRSAHCAVRYGERAVVLDTHAAIHLRSITGIDTRYATGYHAAGDGLIAVFIRHPRTVLVYAELPLRLRFRAVCQRHARVFPRHRDEAVFSGDRQHMVVQIQRDRTCDLQRAVDGHVLRQRIHAAAQAVSDIGGDVVRFQLCSGGSGKRLHRYPGVLAHGVVRRQHLHRQQRQRHAQRHQGGNHPFSHACSSFSSAGISPRWKSYRISSAWNSRSMMRWATARMSMVPRNASTRCSSSSGTL